MTSTSHGTTQQRQGTTGSNYCVAGGQQPRYYHCTSTAALPQPAISPSPPLPGKVSGLDSSTDDSFTTREPSTPPPHENSNDRGLQELQRRTEGSRNSFLAAGTATATVFNSCQRRDTEMEWPPTRNKNDNNNVGAGLGRLLELQSKTAASRNYIAAAACTMAFSIGTNAVVPNLSQQQAGAQAAAEAAAAAARESMELMEDDDEMGEGAITNEIQHSAPERQKESPTQQKPQHGSDNNSHGADDVDMSISSTTEPSTNHYNYDQQQHLDSTGVERQPPPRGPVKTVQHDQRQAPTAIKNDQRTGTETVACLPTSNNKSWRNLPRAVSELLPFNNVGNSNAGTTMEELPTLLRRSCRRALSSLGQDSLPVVEGEARVLPTSSECSALDEGRRRGVSRKRPISEPQRQSSADDESSYPGLTDAEKLLVQEIEDSIVAQEEYELIQDLEQDIPSEAAEIKANSKVEWACCVPAEFQDTRPFYGINHSLARSNWNAIMKRKSPTSSHQQRTQQSLVQHVYPTRAVMAHQKIPKLLIGHSSCQLLVSPETFEEDVIRPFRKEFICPDEEFSFSVSLTDAPGDPSSYRMTAMGNACWVDRFKHYFNNWFRKKWLRFCYRSFFEEGNHSLLDVVVHCHVPLAASLEPISKPAGLWVDVDASGGDATASELGACLPVQVRASRALTIAIMKVDGTECYTTEQLEKLLQQAKDAQRKAVLTIAVSRDTDLSSIDNARVDRIHEPAPLAPRLQPTVIATQQTYLLQTVQQPAANGAGSASVGAAEESVPSQDPVSASNEDQQSADPLVGTNRKRMAANFEAYQIFKAKFKELTDIEYGRTAVNKHFVFSEMWRRHKVWFKSSCDDGCACLEHTKELCENILDLYMTKLIKEGKDIPANLHMDPPVGFVNRFISKFLPLLREKYADEQPPQLQARLVRMWAAHQRQRNFGLKCQESCECGTGWVVVFKEGAVGSASSESHRSPSRPAVASAKRRKISAEQTGGNGSEASRSSVDFAMREHIPRRSSDSRQSSSSLTSFADPIQKGHSCSAARAAVPYSVTYPGNKRPLGFYCVTERNDGATRCKITSVHETGQSRNMSLLIHEGTCVEHIEYDGTKYPIKTHHDLLQFYTHSVEQGKPLTLWFINSDVTTSKEKHPEDWNFNGRYRGPTMDGGWAGGSELVSFPSLGHSKTNVHWQMCQPETTITAARTSPPGVQRDNPKKAQEVQLVSMRVPRHCELHNLTSALLAANRQGRSTRGNKIVSFGEVDESFFFKDRPSSELMKRKALDSPGMSHAEVRNENGTLDSSRIPWGDAVLSLKEMSCNELLGVLKRVSWPSDREKVLKQMIYEAKEQVSNISNSKERKEMESKRTIMKIYLNAFIAIDLAQNLKRWEAYDVEVERIENLHQSVLSTRLSKFVTDLAKTVKGEKGKENSGSRTVMDFAEIVNFGAGGAARPNCTLHSNPSDKRGLAVTLLSGNDVLGTCSIEFDEIRLLATKTGEPRHLEKAIVCGELLEPGARMVFQLRKAVVSAEYLNEKKKIGRKCIQTVMDLIETFRKDPESQRVDPSWGTQTLNICGRHKFSLVHASIYFENPSLVRALVREGADPRSALFAARSLADREKEGRNERVRTEAEDGEELEELSEGEVSHEEATKPSKIQEVVSRFDEIVQILSSCNSSNRSTESTSQHAAVACANFPGENADSSEPQFDEPQSPNGRLAVLGTAEASTGHDAAYHDSFSSPLLSPQPDQEPLLSSQDGEMLHIFLLCVVDAQQGSDSWVLDSQVAQGFYKALGWSDKLLYSKLRCAAIYKDLVTLGQKNLERPDSPVVPCGYEFRTDLSKHSFLHLTSSGVAFTSRPDLLLSPSSSRPQVQKSQQSNQGCEMLPRFLRCIVEVQQGPDSWGWASYSQVAIAFYKALGRTDKLLCSKLRRAAILENLVTLGRNSLATPGNPIVACGLEDRNGLSTASFLRLTSAGVALIGSRPGAWSSNDRSPGSIPEEEAGRSLPSASYNTRAGQQQNQDILRILLESFPTNGQEWVPMRNIARNFFYEFGSEDESRFMAARIQATHENLIEWGREDLVQNGQVKVCSMSMCPGLAGEAYLRLREGRGLVNAEGSVGGGSDNRNSHRRSSASKGGRSNAQNWNHRWSASEDGDMDSHRREQTHNLDRRADHCEKMQLRRTMKSSIREDRSYYGSNRSSGHRAERCRDARCVDTQRSNWESHADRRRGRYHESSSSSPEAADASDLPVLESPLWFVESKIGWIPKECRFFGLNTCQFGTNCRFAHVQPYLGSCAWEGPGIERERLDDVKVHLRRDRHGRTWFTAAYYDRQGNIYYRAEGGSSGGRRSSEGVFWYAREEDARRSVESVYAYHHHLGEAPGVDMMGYAMQEQNHPRSEATAYAQHDQHLEAPAVEMDYVLDNQDHQRQDGPEW